MRQRFPGLKFNTEDTDLCRFIGMSGREAFQSQRSMRVTECGAFGRENVGLSNRIAGESPAHRKSKVSLAMVFNQGLGGPKANPKGEADGQSVNIPTLGYFFNSKTQYSSLGR